MRILAVSLVFLCFVSAPAGAQFVGRHDYGPVEGPTFGGDSSLPGPGIGRELHDVRSRIDRARDSGRLSRSEARQLRREARAIEALAERSDRNGLSPSESRELEARARALGDAADRPR
jgi:hypothetical protein